MWQTDDEEMSGFSGCVEPKEVMIYHTPNSFLVDAELCRDPSCGVDHVYPIDVVFSVHKKGPLQWWSSCFAPGVAGVRYRDKKDVAEGEITVQKRHLSELDRPHEADAMFGHTREHSWTAMQKLMSVKYGTYLKLETLDRLKKKVATSADAKRADILHRVFAQLMFDRTYFEAAKANRFEARTDVSAHYPLLTPAGLTDVARKQWEADFETLVAYAQKQERNLNPLKKGKAKKKFQRWEPVFDTAPRPPQEAAYEAPKTLKPPHPLRAANQELYAANKQQANENASAEAKLQRTKATLSALASKIETKLEASQGPGGPMQRLSSAVAALLQHSEKEDTTQDAAVNPEVAMLTEQLKKLDLSNERLQNERAEQRKQLVAARQKKKAA